MASMAPHWLDPVIEAAIKNGYDEHAIAGAIAHSQRFMKAVRDGIAAAKQGDANKKANPKAIGDDAAQSIRAAVVNAVTADA